MKECTMKPLVILALTTLLIVSVAGMSSAGMYWKGETDRTTNITDADFDRKAPTQKAASKRIKMYDDYASPSLADEPATGGDTSSVTQPIRPRTTPRSVTTPRDTSATTAPRGPRVNRSRPAQPVSDRPKPVVGTPGTGPRSVSGPTQLKIEPPAENKPDAATASANTKRMPWGKVDVKPSEPAPAKFKWGTN